MEGLGEEVEQFDFGDPVVWRQARQVAGKRSRVTGEIDQARRRQLRQRFGHAALQPGARGVEHHHVALLGRLPEKVGDGGGPRFHTFEVSDVGRQVGGGFRAGFHGDHARKLFRQRARKEAHAGVEVECHLAFEAGGGAFDCRRHQVPVHLEERLVADAPAVRARAPRGPPQSVGAALVGGGLVELEGEEAVEFGAEGFGERNGVEVDPGSAEGEPESLVAVVGEGFRTAQAERQGARGAEAIEHGNELVELGGDQRALLDRAEVVGAGAVVAHFQRFGHHWMWGEFQLYAVAVVPGRGGVDGDFFFPVELAQPPQGFAQDVHFQL